MSHSLVLQQNSITLLTTLLVVRLSSSKSSSSSPQRIVGGHACFIHNHPFIVTISPTSWRSSNCAGTLIQPRWVLTAAHCFATTDARESMSYQIQAGSSHSVKFYSTEDEDPQVVDVSTLYFPDDSDGPLYVNDIALMHLKKALELTDHIALAKLPQPSTRPGKFCDTTLSMGWGEVKSMVASQALEAVSADWLRCLELPMVTDSVCEAFWKHRVIKDMVLCAKFDEKDKGNCYGDSGGPIVCRDALDTVIGIVSKGLGCGKATPAAYTRVDAYLDWIEWTIQYNSGQVIMMNLLFVVSVVINFIK